MQTLDRKEVVNRPGQAGKRGGELLFVLITLLILVVMALVVLPVINSNAAATVRISTP